MADMTEGLLGQELSSPHLVKTPSMGTSQQLPALPGPLGATPMGLIIKQSQGKAKGRLTLAGQCLGAGLVIPVGGSASPFPFLHAKGATEKTSKPTAEGATTPQFFCKN